MKDHTKKYSAMIHGTEYEFTAHSTKSGARKSLHEAHNPVLCELEDGWYDSFPAGHPLPDRSRIIEVSRLTARGHKFVPVNQDQNPRAW